MNLDPLLDSSEHALFQEAMLQYSERCVRMHVRRLYTELPFEVTQVPWYSPGRLLVDSSVRPASFLNYATADYYIQDAASLLPLALLDPQPTDKICDLCASPGGKASGIAEHLGADGFLLANESIRTRVDVLRYALAKTGNPCFAVSSYDPDDLASRMPNAFDAVLVDAPCSGQTLVARNKRDGNAFSENQIEHCALRQQRILQSAIRLLKVGGRLIYSTCTFAVEENESQIQWLQEQYPDAWEPIEPTGLEQWRSPVQAGCYRLWPHRDHCAGGFAAGLRLTREIEFEPSGSTQRASKFREVAVGKAKQKSELEKQKCAREALDGLGDFSHVAIEWRNGLAQCLNAGMQSVIDHYPQVAMEPMAVLIESGNHFVPTQGLALLNGSLFASRRSIELAVEQAKQFASGASIALPLADEGGAGGWSVATWNGHPLGWCKALRNRLNNHLPPWARLNLS